MRKIIFPLALLASLSACEQTIDFDIPNPGDRLTVELRLESDSVAKAFISHSTYVLSNADPQPLNDAQAVLIGPQGARDSLLRSLSNGDGVYRGSLRLRAGETYRVEIEHPRYPAVSGRDIIPRVPALIQTSLDTAKKEIVISWQDPADQENYYLVIYRMRNGSGFSSPSWVSTLDPDAEFFDFFVDPLDQDDGRKQGSLLYLRDANFNGQRKQLRVSYDNDFWLPPGSSLSFELEFASLSRSYYLFDRSKAFNNNSIGLFSFEEPVPLYNNIEDGYGAIAGRSSLRVELIP